MRIITTKRYHPSCIALEISMYARVTHPSRVIPSLSPSMVWKDGTDLPVFSIDRCYESISPAQRLIIF